MPLAGSGPCDAAGMGRRWPDLNPISYREAIEFARAANTESGRRDADGNRWFVIVLTVAHLDHDPRNCDPSNLKALCQRCHLRYDIEHHGETAYQTRRSGKAIGDLFGSSLPQSEGNLELSLAAQRASEQAMLALAEPYEPPEGVCPSPINGKTTVKECRAAGQCGCSAEPQ